MLLSQTEARTKHKFSRSAIAHWIARGWLEPVGRKKNPRNRWVDVYEEEELFAAKKEAGISRASSARGNLTGALEGAAQKRADFLALHGGVYPKAERRRGTTRKPPAVPVALPKIGPSIKVKPTALKGTTTRASRAKPKSPTVVAVDREFERVTFHYTKSGLDRAIRELERIAKIEDAGLGLPSCRIEEADWKRKKVRSGKDTAAGRSGDEGEVLCESDQVSSECGSEGGSVQGLRRGPFIAHLPPQLPVYSELSRE